MRKRDRFCELERTQNNLGFAIGSKPSTGWRGQGATEAWMPNGDRLRIKRICIKTLVVLCERKLNNNDHVFTAAGNHALITLSFPA